MKRTTPSTLIFFSRRRLLAAAATSAIASLTAQAQTEQRITIEAGFYTLEEVALLLSVPGDRGRCYPTIRGRGVLLCIKEKELTEARQAICETLGLVIRPYQGRYQWEIAPDKTVEAQEERWRNAYAARADVALGAYIKRVEKCIAGRSYEQWEKEWEAIRAQIDLSGKVPVSDEKQRKELFVSELNHSDFWIAIRRFHRRLPSIRRTILASARPHHRHFNWSSHCTGQTFFPGVFGVGGVPFFISHDLVFYARCVPSCLSQKENFSPWAFCKHENFVLINKVASIPQKRL
jgi:hypothetical protein